MVEVRRRGDQLQLRPLSPEERTRALVLAEAYLGLARAHAADGRERGQLLEACRQIPVAAREQRLAAGLLKLVLDRCHFEEESTLDPAALRDELFARAASHRRDLPARADFDRDALLAEAAAARGVTAAVIEQALYADLPEAHRLQRAELPGPEGLLQAYDAGGVQAVLLRAVRVEARVSHSPPVVFRELFRKLKFLRLLHQIEPLPAEAATVRDKKKDAGYLITIDGPFSLFESVTRYGLQLALAYPALAACGRFAIEAQLRWGKDRRPLRFVLKGQTATAAESDDAGAGLAPEVQALADAINQLAGPWTARPAKQLVDLPGAGVLVPDLELRHRDGARRVLVEVLGFWSRDAVWRRIELAPKLPTPMVFAVSKHLRVSEAALPDELPAALYVYAKTMSAKALLDRAGSL
jgi:uncharacterized protein